MAVNLKIDTKDVEKQLKKLRNFPKHAKKAANSAINRTLTFTNKRINQEVRKSYNIKAAEIKGTIQIRKSNPSTLRGEINSNDRRLSLGRFQRGKFKKGKPVKVRVTKSAKVVNTNPKAFVISLNGNTHVAKRTGKNNYPIEVLRTLSVPQMIASKKVEPTVTKESQEYLLKRTKHEIEYQMKKIIGGR